MDNMLFTAMTAAKQTMLAQAVNANNLANVNTTGFHADLVRMQTAPDYIPVYETHVDMSEGGTYTTGKDLDVAIKGEGWFAVQSPDGSESYTRAGDFQLTATGQLLTGAGYPVIGNGGPIAIPPAEKLDIGADGTISIRPIGQSASSLAVIDRIKLVKPDKSKMVKNEHGLFRMVDGNPATADSNVKVAPGNLQGSNVNAIEALVTMIDLARKYETQVKMMRTISENSAASAKLMTLN